MGEIFKKEKPNAILPFSGERLTDGHDIQTEIEHFHRYFFARSYCRGKDVLDIASGEGYGSAILAQVASSVVGVDICNEVVLHAQEVHIKSNLKYLTGDVRKIPLDDHSVDVVVSFETLEHFYEHDLFMEEVKRVLRPDGCLIISTPNSDIYSAIGIPANPYHVNELTKTEYTVLGKKYFKHISTLNQRTLAGSLLIGDTEKTGLPIVFETRDNEYVECSAGLSRAYYLISVMSDSDNIIVKNSIYINQGIQHLLSVNSQLFQQRIDESKSLILSLESIDRDKNKHIENLEGVLVERNKLIENLEGVLVERNKLIENLEGVLVERNKLIENLEGVLVERNKLIENLACDLDDFNKQSKRSVINWIQKMMDIRAIYNQLKIGFITQFKISIINYIQAKKKVLVNFLSREEPGKQNSKSSDLFEQLFNQAKNDKKNYVPYQLNESVKSDIKLIAFYLPQFHPIPENDEWWGKGFTEWTNVSKAVPQFIGHYQPHLPDELGFYDLRIKDIQKRQIELAKNYGIYGFCYYHYWFAGKRLLSKPFQTVLENADLDLPFCLCWANENWTRRWDGLDNEVLIKQVHSDDDDIAFIKDIDAVLRDKRYIRIKGRPLLIVYQPLLLPDPAKTAERWRKYCIQVGIGDLYLAVARAFGITDTIPTGFDALIEFPPHHLAVGAVAMNDKVTLFNPDYRGCIIDYNYLIERALDEGAADITLYRTVVPSWDNEARKPGRGYSFVNSSPNLYKKWLKNSIKYSQDNNIEKLVFINAWNEWAEGAHLEPDQKYGYAWLQATYDALSEASQSKKQRKLVLVSHDAHTHGAQYLALHLAKTLVTDFDFQIDLILLDGGTLISAFAQWTTVHNLSGIDPEGELATALADTLRQDGHTVAIANTTVSGLFLGTLSKAGLRTLSLIHELPGTIKQRNLLSCVKSIIDYADAIVFPAKEVAHSFGELAPLQKKQIKIKPQGLIKKNTLRDKKEYARNELRKILNIQEASKIVLGMGYADHRKGVDLFIKIGLKVLETHPKTYFVWVGHWETNMQKQVQALLSNQLMRDHFFLDGFNDDTDVYFAGADVFALTSREDPFPSVVLQSLEVGVPVVGFVGSGGFSELLETGCGLLSPLEDTGEFANNIIELLDNKEKNCNFGNIGAQIIQKDFSFSDYIFDLLSWVGAPIKRVSVVVPNYNYARFLEERISSIINQTYPVFEIIILDDASTDNSLQVIAGRLFNTKIPYQIVNNELNSGSVFQQWQRGVALARGDFIWICEADDSAAPTFLEKQMHSFDDESVVMSYSQSRQVDEVGEILANDYHVYTDDISTDKWLQDYVCEGTKELAEALCIKNTIPNVSAVIFRKTNLIHTFKQCSAELPQLKVAGDWLIYSNILRTGHIAFTAESLNDHRRHVNSVTYSSISNEQHLSEIIYMQRHVAERMTIAPIEIKKANEYISTVSKNFKIDNTFYSIRKPIEN